jgi:lipopolysaccharide/colanic/teichoic acid biosynthesis glycosyltransferase
VPVWRVWLSFLAALVLLVLFSPLLVISYLLVRLTSRGPGFYHQTRMGLDGECFEVLKLRTMYLNAEAETGAVWAKPGDPRVTPVGHWLRMLHLDELPQLVNILRGEMGFVGPRPERPEIVEKLLKDIPEYPFRLAVRPGVTGLAQINLPADTDLNSVRRKLALDCEYIATNTLWMDLCIIVATLPHALGIQGKFFNRLLGVHRHLKDAAARPSQPVTRPRIVDRDFARATTRHTEIQVILDEAVERVSAANDSIQRLLVATTASLRDTEREPLPGSLYFLNLASTVWEAHRQTEMLMLQGVSRVTADMFQQNENRPAVKG